MTIKTKYELKRDKRENAKTALIIIETLLLLAFISGFVKKTNQVNSFKQTKMEQTESGCKYDSEFVSQDCF